MPIAKLPTEESLGLYGKYIVTKANGDPVDPEAEYLVLRIDKDPGARWAAETYADYIQSQMPELAADIRERVRQYRTAKFLAEEGES